MRKELLVFIVAAGMTTDALAERPKVSGGWLDIVGDRLYLAGFGNGFHVLDISDPVHPKWLGGWSNHTCPVGVQVVDDLAYLANRTSGFEVIDVNNPEKPTPIGHLSTGGDLNSVNISGHFAYVADIQRGLDIIDVSDPNHPKLAGELKTKGQGWSAVANGDFVYAGFGGGGLRVFHLENGTNLTQIGEPKFPGGTALQIVGDTLFCGGNGSLAAFSLANPEYPCIIGDSRPPVGGKSMVVSGQYAYATSGYKVVSISDVSNPRNILEVGHTKAGYQSWSINVAGRHAYVVDGGANLHIFDVSDPRQPREVGGFPASALCSKVLSLTNSIADKTLAQVTGKSSGAITDAPPELAGAARMDGDAFSFTLRGIPGEIYLIQASTNLASWECIATNTLPANGTLSISDPDAHLFANRFYRAVKKP